MREYRNKKTGVVISVRSEILTGGVWEKITQAPSSEKKETKPVKKKKKKEQ